MMSGYVVVERPTGPVDDKDDKIFGPFQVPAVADLWIGTRKNDLNIVAELTKTEAFHKRHPRIYFIHPLYEPKWS